MNNENHTIKILIYSYPDNKATNSIIDLLETFVGDLRSNYDLPLQASITDGFKENSKLAEFYYSYLSYCHSSIGKIDTYGLWLLRNIILGGGQEESQTNEYNKYMAETYGDYPSELRELADQALKNSFGWKEYISPSFINAPGRALTNPVNAGETSGMGLISAVSLETSERKELIFHEFLHIFFVSDGYDEDTLITIPGCEKCWMQYDPHGQNANSLCEKHKSELIGFLSNPHFISPRL
jgi:hypothetical protein